MDTPLWFSTIKEHLTHHITYKELDADLIQAIKNNDLSTIDLDCLQSTHQLDSETRGIWSNQIIHALNFFMFSPKSTDLTSSFDK